MYSASDYRSMARRALKNYWWLARSFGSTVGVTLLASILGGTSSGFTPSFNITINGDDLTQYYPETLRHALRVFLPVSGIISLAQFVIGGSVSSFRTASSIITLISSLMSSPPYMHTSSTAATAAAAAAIAQTRRTISFSSAAVRFSSASVRRFSSSISGFISIHSGIPRSVSVSLPAMPSQPSAILSYVTPFGTFIRIASYLLFFPRRF
jgi:cytochrome bd-type quinol oxidase subunit 2